jgi:hypothetical protein
MADIRRTVTMLGRDYGVDLAAELEEFLVAVRECRPEVPGPVEFEDFGF